MRIISVLPAALAVVGLATGGPAAAQVQVDPRALDALQPPASGQTAAPAQTTVPPDDSWAKTHKAKKPAKETSPKDTPKTTKGTGQTAKPPAGTNTGTTKSVPSSGKPAPPAKPTVPTAPPPVPVVPPPVAVPTRPVTPPTPATVTPDAPGEAADIPGGVRLTFGPTRADLNPATDQALRHLVHAAPPTPTTTFTVVASAAGTPEDPSTARRVSLDRALAVRSVLIAEGIPSVRIYVKALGATAPETSAPPDRVDIVVSAPPPSTTPAATAPSATPAVAPAGPATPARTAPRTVP